MPSATIEARGVERTRRALGAMADRGADARPAWPSVEALLRADVEDRFARQGRGGWAPLAASTRARDKHSDNRRRGASGSFARGRDPRVMRASGALYRALTAQQARGGVRRRAKTQLRFGTSIFYARFHEKGEGLPKRPLLTVSQQLERRIARTLERFVAHGKNGGTATVLRSRNLP